MNKYSAFAVLPMLLLLTGCANNVFNSYKDTSDQQFTKIYAGQAKTAITAKDTSDALFNMEYGMLLRLTSDYPTSNTYFGRAQASMEAWSNSWSNTTSGQLSASALTMLLNDNISDYQPKGYEKSFLATYYALNQIDLNDLDDARVAIKQMYEIEQATQNYNDALYNAQTIEAQKNAKDKTSNYLSQEIMKKYNFPDINSPQVLALKNSYQNAFSHYLAGFIFEALNEPSLSRPGYVKAGQLNPTNKLIQKSINNLDNGVQPKSGYTDLLIVESVGHAPQIQSMQTSVPINLNLTSTKNQGRVCINSIDIFYPKLVVDKTNQAIYPYTLDNSTMNPLPMVNVDLMTARALHDEIPHLIARNIAAALRNIALAQASCSEKNDQAAGLLNLGAIFAGKMLDKVDERTFTLLPSKININRISLPYGNHTIVVNVNGVKYNQTITLNQPYQIVGFRIMGNQVFFNTMVTT